METEDAGDESGNMSRRGKFLRETTCQFKAVWQRLLEFAREPRQIIFEMKNSKTMHRLIIALLASEVAGACATGFSLAIAPYFTGALPFTADPRCQDFADVGGALILNYQVANVAFYVTWAILGYKRYCQRGLALVPIDLALFNGLDVPIKWMAITCEASLAAFLLQAGFSKSFAVYLPYLINILPATFLFALLALPFLTARPAKRFSFRALTKKIFWFPREISRGYRASKIWAKVRHAKRRELLIEIQEWVRLYCIQTRAGPPFFNRPAKFVGLFLWAEWCYI